VWPPETHTKDEKPFSPRELEKIFIEAGLHLESLDCVFPYSFGLAYLLGKTRWRGSPKLTPLCRPVETSEKLIENVPLFNRLGSTLIAVAKKA
jgi:hypothetical protein